MLELAQQIASPSQFEHQCWNQSFTKLGEGDTAVERNTNLSLLQLSGED